MKARISFMQALVFAALCLCSPGPLPAEIANRVVAIVNADIVTLYELNLKMKELTGLTPEDLKERDEKGYLETRRRVLDLLIDEKIAREKIQELGIRVTPKEVDTAIEEIKKANNLTHEDLLAGLKKRGLTYEAYRENLREEIERARLVSMEVKAKIIIREEMIGEYYERHKSEFTKEERVRLAVIVLAKESPGSGVPGGALAARADEILSRIRQGEDFGALAKRFSQGPAAQEGGDLGFFKVAELDPQLRALISGVDEGEVRGPVERANGVQFIKVLTREKGGLTPLEEAKNAIYDVLYREEVNRRYASWIKELRAKAYTRVIF